MAISGAIFLFGNRIVGLGAYGYPGIFLVTLISSSTVILPAPGLAFAFAAGATLNCTYSAALPDAASRTNTATATLQNFSYDDQKNATKSGTTDFSGTANMA